MKKLLIALVAAVAVSTVFAKNTKQGFEENKTGFVAVGEGDESDRAEYGTATKPSPVADLFDTAGDYFLELDTGDATLWATNSGDATFFDMNMQFNPCATAPEVESGTKIAVYLNSSSNLVVISGPNVTTNVTGTTLNPGTWGRLSISATNGLFTVSLNGAVVGSYESLTGVATVQSVGFKGSGALDNYVARTTDPFLQNPAVSIDGEGYASIEDAKADDPTAIPQLARDTSLATPLAYGESISVKLNGHTLSGITTGSLIAFASTEGDVTTYTAGYFPRTATAGQDGTAEHPYEIADADDLVALQDAVFADAAFRSKSYVQTANIDMAGVTGFYGVGFYASTDAYDSSLADMKAAASAQPGIPFSGTFDGNGKMISNLTLVKHNYSGVFNVVSGGTVKDLTVSNFVGFTGTASEGGFAIVGATKGTSVLQNLTMVGTFGSSSDLNHNSAGIVVRAGDTTTITGCVNNANIAVTAKRVGGIVGFTGDSGNILVTCCTNNGNLSASGDNGAKYGAGGISGTSEASQNLKIANCANFGTVTISSTYTANGGLLVGNFYSRGADELGGNTYLASGTPFGNINGKVLNKCSYALPSTIDAADYLTTVKQADLAAGNTYTLVADVAAGTVYTFAAAGTIAFNTNGYNFAGTVVADNPNMIDVTSATEGSVITYTAAGGVAVATVITDEGAVTNEYNTIQKAITAAGAAGVDTVNLIANAAISGELNIPAGVTVVLASGVSLVNVTRLSGAGVLLAPSPTEVGLVQTDHAASLLKDGDAWTGTLSIKNASLNGPDGLSYYGNTNSTVRMENVWLSNWTSSHAVGALELVGLGVYITSMSGNMTFPCALTGNGSISLRDGSESQRTMLFSGDVSTFAGNITIATDTKSRIVFGTNVGTAGNNNCIVVDQGAAATVAEGKTWTAPNGFVIKGDLTVDGSLSAGGNSLYGTGTVRFNGAAGLAVAGTWTGKYIIGWAGATGTAIAFDSYGNAKSTIEIPEGSTLHGYVGSAQGGTYNLAASNIVVNGVLNLTNGYNTSTVNWKKISGSGVLKFSFAPSTAIYENITLLDGFTGSIEVSKTTQLTIGTVNIAREPSAGQRIVAMTVTEGGTVGGDLNLTVSGAAYGALEYKTAAEGAEGEGLYVKPTYEITFISGEGSTTNVVPTLKGETPVAPTPAEVAGKTFNSWTPAIVAATEATTYTATYTATSYTITLDANGGKVDPASTNYTADTAAFDLPIATTSNVGVQFAGWTNETITVAFTNFVPSTTAALGNITLYAKWDTTGSTSYGDGTGNTFSIDAGAAAKASENLPAGKTLNDAVSASSSMTYAQAYALGLLNETTGAVDELDATIELKDGKVVVNLSSAPKSAYTVTLKVYEKQSLTDAWPAEPTQTYTLDSTTATTGFTPGGGVGATANFYKTEVSISNK